ncbi:M23 family metallopeptidase [Erythrobacter sp. SDW2]|uniref:M23 family metallopeptidase n=1 Tax=Erythrobacter sp. SDW2 TaxID=2907154 RepID=UPI001F3AD2B4|nr:M23 family metallopeptidase [Erythrobacter sp. SDW2]UIP07339.1 M23 family metallopeptidase [Erythrobacter sp. SDW2]
MEDGLYQARAETAAGILPGDTASGDWRAAALSHAQMIDDAAPRIIQRARTLREKFDGWKFEASEKLDRMDLAPDLAEAIGSARWLRGMATLIGLGAFALSFWPTLSPLEAAPAQRLDQTAREELRSHAIMPLALGGDTGSRMSATALVEDLPAAPERPQIQLVATLVQGDSFGRMLQRAGVGTDEAGRVTQMVSRAIPLGEIAAGTQLDITLGRRPAPGATRPIDAIEFRARFDLALAISRDAGGNLALVRKPIRVDDTPLRIRGTVGTSLYRSARAAGAPASAVQQYLKAIGENADIDSAVRAGDTFDMIVTYRRAATGERQAGQLIFAGVERAGRPTTQLMRWGSEGRFFEASGIGEQKSGLMAPVPGPIGSRFGMRKHPILGYRRMHSGLDYRAAYGTPIRAVTDGRVLSAGRAGGCGIAVKLGHGGGLQTRYCHMSRMAVSAGQTVRRGQVIGYVGSTGLSTGPHLHFEMFRGGRAVDPQSVSYVTRAQLSGEELARFRSTLAQIKQIEVGAALADLEKRPEEQDEPKREIDKLANRQSKLVG